MSGKRRVQEKTLAEKTFVLAGSVRVMRRVIRIA